MDEMNNLAEAMRPWSERKPDLEGYEEDADKRKEREKAYCAACEGIEACQYAEIGNRGFEPIWEEWSPLYAYVKECRHRRLWGQRVRNDRLFGESGVPLEHKGLRLEELEGVSAEAFEVMVDLIAGERRRAYVHLPEGGGKTRLVSATANEFMRRGVAVRYTEAVSLLGDLRYSEGYERRLKVLEEVPVLIVEDLGSERATEYVREQLECLLSKRRRGGKITILTSRLSAEEESRRYSGGRLRSELA